MASFRVGFGAFGFEEPKTRCIVTLFLCSYKVKSALHSLERPSTVFCHISRQPSQIIRNGSKIRNAKLADFEPGFVSSPFLLFFFSLSATRH